MKKNVLFVMRWPEEKGHMGDRVRASYEEVAKSLSARGIKCFISYPGPVNEKNPAEALWPLSLDCFNLRTITNIVAIINVLRQNKIGIVFYIDPLRQWMAVAYFKLFNIKTVYYCRYGYPPTFEPVWLKQILKWFYHRLNLWDSYIAISSHIKSCFLERELIPTTKIMIVRNGLNPVEFSRHSSIEKPVELQLLPSDAIVVLSVAQIRPEKRIDTFLAIASKIINANLGLSIYFYHIGDGPDLNYYRAQSQDNILQNRIYFLGKKLNVKEFMQHSDILLHTSEKEGICNVIGEAMLMGLPIVAANIGGNVEQVLNGVTGYLNPINDINSYANVIAVLSKDVELRKSMGMAGREKIIKDFSINKQVNGLIVCIENLLKI
jgi:glycosyltransferase involved in cell wall biosynthesis